MANILSTKLRNAIMRENPSANYEFHLRNIIVNGNKRGCSGFIVNKDNNVVVYVNTEQTCNPMLGYMYRFADSIKDYSGHTNNWARNYESFVTSVTKCLEKGERTNG